MVFSLFSGFKATTNFTEDINNTIINQYSTILAQCNFQSYGGNVAIFRGNNGVTANVNQLNINKGDFKCFATAVNQQSAKTAIANAVTQTASSDACSLCLGFGIDITTNIAKIVNNAVANLNYKSTQTCNFTGDSKNTAIVEDNVNSVFNIIQTEMTEQNIQCLLNNTNMQDAAINIVNDSRQVANPTNTTINIIIMVVIGVIVLTIVGVAVYLIYRYQKSKGMSQRQDPLAYMFKQKPKDVALNETQKFNARQQEFIQRERESKLKHDQDVREIRREKQEEEYLMQKKMNAVLIEKQNEEYQQRQEIEREVQREQQRVQREQNLYQQKIAEIQQQLPPGSQFIPPPPQYQQPINIQPPQQIQTPRSLIPITEQEHLLPPPIPDIYHQIDPNAQELLHTGNYSVVTVPQLTLQETQELPDVNPVLKPLISETFQQTFQPSSQQQLAQQLVNLAPLALPLISKAFL